MPDPAARYETIQWLMFQIGGIGPMFGRQGLQTPPASVTLVTLFLYPWMYYCQLSNLLEIYRYDYHHRSVHLAWPP